MKSVKRANRNTGFSPVKEILVKDDKAYGIRTEKGEEVLPVAD